MATIDNSPQVETARRIERAIEELLREGADVPRPSDSYLVLGSLARAHAALTRVLEQWAEWHAAVELGVHLDDDEEDAGSENPSWARAERELRDAATSSRATAEALDRAHTANGVASWFDEIRAFD